MNIKYIKSNLKNLANYKRIKDLNYYFIKKELLHTIKRADELLNQIFTFDKPWDMERCIKPYYLEIIDWNIICNDDEEWCFMLNRMDYLSDLVIAYLYTNDEKYIEKTKFYIIDWIKNHKIIEKKLSTRTLDTAIRIMSWVQACIVLEYNNQLSNEELNIICDSIIKQVQFLKDNYMNKYKTSNWGSIQTTILISVLPILIEDYKTNSLYKWAYEEMKLQLSIQVYPDGMFWEQSTMYHVEVLNYGMNAIYYYKYFNNNIKEEWMDYIENLANSLFYQLTPTFEIEAFGDSDRMIAKDVFNRASVLFENPEYKYAGNEKYDIESLYIFGCNFADKYQDLDLKIPKKYTYDGKDSGMYIIRSNWGNRASFTMFTNGSLGSGHGHSDNLHISIIYKGEFMLIDTGRYTYREDNPLRLELKSSYAHNGIVLNNSPYCIPKSSWEYDNFGIIIKNYVKHKGKYHYLEGGIIGNNPLQIWIRKVVIINPNIWLIADEVKADRINNATLYYHIDPYKKVEKKDDSIYIYGNYGTLKIIQGITPNIETKKCSLRYNELLDHNVISYDKRFENELQFITCICDEKIKVENVPLYQSNMKTLIEVGQARKFKISVNESYTIAVYHKEIYQGRKILFCEGVAFHGKCAIIHEKNGKKSYRLMKA